MKASLKRRDYKKYVWKRSELFVVLLQSVAVVLFLAYFFYKSIWAVIPLVPVGVAYVRMCERERTEKARKKLEEQFKECMLSVSTSLKAGYAVENAFLESCGDMKVLYGEESLIYRELEFIRRGLVINITLEELLDDLGKRSDCEEIKQFARIFSIAKRSGGNLSEIIRSSTELIGQRIELHQEMQALLSGKKMELCIMKAMPFGILTYIGITYPGYFDDLYHNWQGVLIMTVCLGIYLLAFCMGNRIMCRIEEELIG